MTRPGTQFRLERAKRPIRLVKIIGSPGGEGSVWETDVPGLLAKIYHKIDSNNHRKLICMIGQAPVYVVDGHLIFAWPEDILLNSRGQCVGFVMKRVVDALPLSDIFNPANRRYHNFDNFGFGNLLVVTKNMASASYVLHEHGYVIGDFLPTNFLVLKDGKVSFIDIDSKQVRNNKTKELFHCRVCWDQALAPELLDSDLSRTERTKYADYFQFGIIASLILRCSAHPYGGIWQGPGEMPDIATLVKKNECVYRPGSKLLSHPNEPALASLHPTLMQLLTDCFVTGHSRPEKRPTFQAWIDGCDEAIKNLVSCDTYSALHHYDNSNKKCPWCWLLDDRGIDYFNAKANGKSARRSIKKAASSPPTSSHANKVHASLHAGQPSGGGFGFGIGIAIVLLAIVFLIGVAGSGSSSHTSSTYTGPSNSSPSRSPSKSRSAAIKGTEKVTPTDDDEVRVYSWGLPIDLDE